MVYLAQSQLPAAFAKSTVIHPPQAQLPAAFALAAAQLAPQAEWQQLAPQVEWQQLAPQVEWQQLAPQVIHPPHVAHFAPQPAAQPVAQPAAQPAAQPTGQISLDPSQYAQIAQLVEALDDQSAMTVVCQVLAHKQQIVPVVMGRLMVAQQQQAALIAAVEAAAQEDQAAAAAMVAAAAEVAGSSDRAGKRYVGSVKSFNHEKGYGFIACSEVKAAFGKDVFLHHLQLAQFTLGSEVSFSISLSKDGQPRGHDLMDATGYVSYLEEAMAAQAANVMRVQQAMPAMEAARAAQRSLDEELADGKKRYVGRIKNFQQHLGYGFIECPDLKAKGFTNDVFLHHQQVRTFQVGDTVMFEVYRNTKGQPQARDLSAAAPGSLPGFLGMRA